jgi:hypothetical protein
MRTDELLVVPLVIVEEKLEDAVEQAEVRAGLDRQVNATVFDGGVADRGLARIHDDEARRVRAGEAVEDARPEDGLRGSHVVADHEERVAVVLRNASVSTRLGLNA